MPLHQLVWDCGKITYDMPTLEVRLRFDPLRSSSTNAHTRARERERWKIGEREKPQTASEEGRACEWRVRLDHHDAGDYSSAEEEWEEGIHRFRKRSNIVWSKWEYFAPIIWDRWTLHPTRCLSTRHSMTSFTTSGKRKLPLGSIHKIFFSFMAHRSCQLMVNSLSTTSHSLSWFSLWRTFVYYLCFCCQSMTTECQL